ncbi:MAG TPA: type II toxin-antitoxin system VapC family toxin, partial [Tepidisphaeraceae bacterium]|nr:type II toxin-antitoxin system VapC family toxin [Tepidisphaeraceae bacterium]
VVIAVIANEPHRDRILQLTADARLVSAGSLEWEIGNAFSAMLKRGRLSLDQARTAIELFRKMLIQSCAVDIDEAVQLTARHKIYAYDAYMIAAARLEDARC